jgi:hypothetical protein
MLYWVRPRRKMIVARFEFKPEYAADFIQDAETGQNVVEVAFDSPQEMIATMREFEDYLIDCIAIVGGKVMALSSFGVH